MSTSIALRAGGGGAPGTLAFGTQAAKSRKQAAAERTFIEASYLIAPQRIGDFELEGASYDERNKYAEAGFRYALKGHQETRFDVFVYPSGRAPQEQAVAAGLANFKASVEEAQRAGYVSDLRILSEDAFPLEAPASAAQDTATATPDTAELLAALASTRTVGRRLRMQNMLVSSGFPMFSNGYLFHRQLYFFKVRASAARERIDQTAFDALTDMAARILVPAIEVANVGGCARKEITLDPKAKPEEMAQVLVRRTAEIQGENCFTDAVDAKVEAKSREARVVRIEFTGDEWKAQ